MNQPPPSLLPALPGSPDSIWHEAAAVTPGGTPLPPWAGQMSGLTGPTPAPAPASTALGGRRFASLSSLPAGRRLPPKRDTIPARHQRESAPPLPVALPVAELSLTSFPVVPDAVARHSTVPLMLPAAVDRQLGFNCPSCFAVLIIKDPTTYDGSPAPCPTCGIRILPPQCVPDSPFSIVHRALPAGPPAWPQISG